MVKHNATHNVRRSGIKMVPLRPHTWMIANWRFAQGQTPELIRQSQIPTNTPKRTIDPFALREEFWDVKSEGGMLDLLNRTGIPWGSEEVLFLDDVFKFREFTKQALRKRISKWQGVGAKTTPEKKIPAGAVWYADAITSLSGMLGEPWKGGVCFQARYSDFKQVILAAVLIDRLEQNRYGVCRRPGCGKLFKIDIRKKRRYCSEAHRQAEVMRRFRRRKAKKT